MSGFPSVYLFELGRRGTDEAHLAADLAADSRGRILALDPATVSDTLGVLLKYQDDIAKLEGGKVKELLDQVQAELRAAE